jgi:cell division protein FtsZ
LINLDFADIRTVMSTQGMAIMGTGAATGENRAVEAATAAISSPLLENISIDGATGIIINVTGGRDLSLHEVNEASTLITEAAHEEAEIIFGAVIDESLGDEVRVTVIATGFGVDQVKLGVPQHYSYQTQPQQPVYMTQSQPPPQYYQPQYQPVPAQAIPQQPLPPIPQQPVYQAAVQQAPVAPVVATPVMPSTPAPMVEESVAPVIDPGHPQYNAEAAAHAAAANSRDMLIAKAKAYREQALKQRELPTEQLSMEMSLDHNAAAKAAAADLSSPFDQSNLDVPTYLRRKQRNEESQDGM